MTLPTISALPTAPNRSTMTDAVFSATADAWVAGLDTFTGETNDVASAVNDLATAADASATAAAAAATASTLGTSTTSVAIGTGSKGPFTTQAGKNWVVGTWLTLASAANPANYMTGQVTAYSGTSLTVNVTAVGGSGTKTDWNIALSGEPGATGATGSAGTNGTDGAGLAYAQIGSPVATTSGTTWSFTSIPATYSILEFVFAAWSHNGGGTRNLQIQVSSDNGSNWSTAVNFGPAFAAADSVYGSVHIFHYRNTVALIVPGVFASATTPEVGGTSNANLGIHTGGAINAVRFTSSSGDSGDAGSITLNGIGV